MSLAPTTYYFGHTKLKFTRRECAQCASETIHRGDKCAVCGELIKRKPSEPKLSFLKRGAELDRKRKELARARIKHYRELAAASRKQFEGG